MVFDQFWKNVEKFQEKEIEKITKNFEKFEPKMFKNHE